MEFCTLEGDLFALADIAAKASYLIVLDAIAGEPVGEIARISQGRNRHAPSFHQADVASVLTHLQAVGVEVPPWEVWGIRIAFPTVYTDELSPPVRRAARELKERVTRRIGEVLRGLAADAEGIPPS